MEKLTEQLADFVAEVRPSRVPPEVLEVMRLHAFDTIGAAFAGARVAETRALVQVVGDLDAGGKVLALGPQVHTALPLAVLLGVASARCSEVDDIHLASCVTPGAIVIPTALAVASWRPGLSDDAFLAGCLAGFEVLIRMGLAIGGPGSLYAGVWPTGIAAGFGVAATVGRMLQLSKTDLAHAFALVAAAATSKNTRIQGLTSRWLTVGATAEQAVLAVLGAAHGLRGDLDLLGEGWARAVCVTLDGDLLVPPPDAPSHIQSLSLKPYCSARQALAAIEGFLGLSQDEGVTVQAIEEILVEVPGPYARMIDHAGPPASRQESISDVRYQLALAALAPDLLLDVERASLLADDRAAPVTSKIKVQADPALEAHYPRLWPARVTATLTGGQRVAREVLRVPGDPGTGFGWAEVEAKLTHVGLQGLGPIQQLCHRLGDGALPELVTALDRLGADPETTRTSVFLPD